MIGMNGMTVILVTSMWYPVERFTTLSFIDIQVLSTCTRSIRCWWSFKLLFLKKNNQGAEKENDGFNYLHAIGSDLHLYENSCMSIARRDYREFTESTMMPSGVPSCILRLSASYYKAIKKSSYLNRKYYHFWSLLGRTGFHHSFIKLSLSGLNAAGVHRWLGKLTH